MYSFLAWNIQKHSFSIMGIFRAKSGANPLKRRTFPFFLNESHSFSVYVGSEKVRGCLRFNKKKIE